MTIFKKGSRTECGNYRGISLLSVAGKILAKILLNRLQPLSESCPTLFSIFLAAFISLASLDQANGVGIIYRTDGELFNMRRLKAKTKVKATSIVDLQYADDCAIAAHTGADLQNTLDAFSQAYKLLGLTVNVIKTKVIFQPAQPLTATAPTLTLKVLPWITSIAFHTWVATSRTRKTSMSKFNTGSDVRAFHTAG